MTLPKIKKLYYSISEVSKMTDVKQPTLRYWENEFSILQPGKNSAGNRVYKEYDIKLIHFIKTLLYSRKLTINGAIDYINQLMNSNELNSQLQLYSIEGLVNHEQSTAENTTPVEEDVKVIDNETNDGSEDRIILLLSKINQEIHNLTTYLNEFLKELN
jgi:DNA-binding transcriptional MerR regulator